MTDPEENEKALPFLEDWANILGQEDFWVTYSGWRIPLDAMSPAHCADTVAFIKRSLSRLAERDLMVMSLDPGPTGDVACDAFDSAMGELEHIIHNAPEWAEGTPLVRALNRRAQGDRGAKVDPVGDVYHRVPKTVQAIRYDGTNLAAVIAFVDDRNILVEERRVAGPGPCRGMQRAVVVSSIHNFATVPVGSWLLVEQGRYSSVPDEIFENDYRKGSTW